MTPFPLFDGADIVVGDPIGRLSINGGSTFNSGVASVARDLLTAGYVQVSGSGSLFNVTSALVVGNADTSEGHVTVLDGASVTSPNITQIGADGIGSLRVSGAGSTFVGGTMVDYGTAIGGGLSTYARLDIENGGAVTHGSTTVGFNNAYGADVVVTGQGSQWTINGSAFLSHGSIVLHDGGAMTTTAPNLGVVINHADGSLHVDGGSLTTAQISIGPGSFSYSSGSLHLTNSALTIGDTPAPGLDPNLLIGPIVTVGVGEAITASGDAAVQAGGRLVVAGAFDAASLLNEGDLVFIDSTLETDLTSSAGSVINVIGDVTFNGSVSGAAGIFGSGNAIFNGGYSPGDSPALVAVENDATFGEANTLFMELGGSAPGAGHDALDVAGTLAVDGALEVSLINGFEPAAGDSFDLFDFGTLSRTFDSVNLPALTGGMSWDQSELYTDGVLLVLSSLSGDYNNDGVVDAADYTVWRDNEDAPAGTLPNDADGGVIGTAQYDTWAANYGETLPALSNAVPEPGGLVLCLAALAPKRRRR